MNVDKEKLAAEVIKYRNGDGRAFEAIYNMTNQAAYFTALKIVKNEDDAQDVLQDSYVKVLDKLSTLDKPESFMSWFNMLVANTAKNYLAKNNPVLFADEETEMYVLESIPEENEVYVPGNSVEKDELCDDVMSLIDSLSDDKRTAVVLYYYDEMTTKQIAESLGINENTVKSRLVQAKKDLAAGIRALEKKNKSILGIAPMSVVRWALNYNGSDAYQKDMPDLAPLLEKIQGLESHGFSALEKIRFRFADFFSHFGSGSGAGHDKGAVFKSAAAVVATAGVVGGAVAGTNAIKNRDKPDISETTTAYVQEIESFSAVETTIKRSDENSNFLGETLEVPEDQIVKVRSNLVTGRYGVRFSSQDYARNTRNGVDTYYGKPVADRSGFSATYEEMLPYAKQNAQTYSDDISSVFNKVNEIRSGSGVGSLEQDEKLAEQAGVRAEEIAWSGRQNAIRPDGTSYTTVFDKNGFTNGTRLEVRAYGKTAADIYKTLASDDSITNRDIRKIGVGVAENPETGVLTFVIHLYSSSGSLENIIGLRDILRDRKDDVSDAGTDFAGDRIENLNNFAEEIKDVPVIGPLLTSDTPLDVVTMKINEWIESIREQRIENKETGN